MVVREYHRPAEVCPTPLQPIIFFGVKIYMYLFSRPNHHYREDSLIRSKSLTATFLSMPLYRIKDKNKVTYQKKTGGAQHWACVRDRIGQRGVGYKV